MPERLATPAMLIVALLMAGCSGARVTPRTAPTAITTPTGVPDPGPGEFGPMLALDDAVVNLQVTSPADHTYVKIGVTVEVRPTDSGFYQLTGAQRTQAESAELARFSAVTPQLQSAVAAVVSSYNSSGLTSSSGRAELKARLLTAMRGILGQKAVLDIFFTDFVMG
jgi:Flagellar basal body-associated protein FliL